MATASRTQRDEMFKAFMAGFAEAFDFHTNILTEMSDDDGCDALTDIQNQLMAFVGKLEESCKSSTTTIGTMT